MSFWKRLFTRQPPRAELDSAIQNYLASGGLGTGSAPSAQSQPAGDDLGASLLLVYQAHVAQFRAPFGRVGCERFIDDCLFSATTVGRISSVGGDKMRLTQADGKGHSASWDSPDVQWRGRKVHFMVETIPAGMSAAAGWYSKQYGGYVQFITNVSNKLGHFGCGVFVHCIFGSDFANVGVLPLWQPDAVTSVIPRTCCTSAERAQFGI